MKVKVLSIEQATECKYDNLKIYDGLDDKAALLTVLCGEDPPKEEITSSGHFVMVKFHSDDLSGGSGFAIEYSSGICIFDPGAKCENLKFLNLTPLCHSSIFSG